MSDWPTVSYSTEPDIARHEALHCAAALLLGIPIEEVRIDRPDVGVEGRVTLGPPPEGVDLLRHTEDRMIVAVLPALADEGHCSGDLRMVSEAIEVVARVAQEDPGDVRLRVLDRARPLLASSDLRAAAGAVKALLQERGRITGAEAEEAALRARVAAL